MFAAQGIHVGSSNHGRLWTQFLGILLGVTVFHFFLAAYLPAAEDELYYWTWSQTLSASYFDHPPVTAWVIRICTFLFGDTIFAIRLPAVLFASLTALVIAALSPKPTLTILFLFTPLFFLGGVLMTPDLPLVFFWGAYLLWTTRIQTHLDAWNCDPVTRVYHNSPISPLDWLGGGCLLGLGLLSKYTMLLAIACSAATFFTRTKPRAWWKGYVLHLLVAGILTLPVILFSARHDWEPLLFQWAHIQAKSAFSGKEFFNFWSGQALLVGLLPLLFLPRVFLNWQYLWNDPRLQPSVVFFLLPTVYFSYKSFFAGFEANWAIVIYLALWPIAQRICQISSFKHWNWIFIGLSFLPAWFATLALMAHMFRPIGWIQPYKDRFRVARARIEIASLGAEELKRQPKPAPIYLPNYQWTALFQFQRADAHQLAIGRKSHFTLQPNDPCQLNSIFFWLPGDNAVLPAELGCFANRSVVKTYLVMVSGHTVENIQLMRLEK